MPLLIIPNPFIDVQKIKNNVSVKEEIEISENTKKIKIRDIYWKSNEKNVFEVLWYYEVFMFLLSCFICSEIVSNYS